MKWVCDSLIEVGNVEESTFPPDDANNAYNRSGPEISGRPPLNKIFYEFSERFLCALQGVGA
jgi:hypothetical protein